MKKLYYKWRYLNIDKEKYYGAKSYLIPQNLSTAKRAVKVLVIFYICHSFFFFTIFDSVMRGVADLSVAAINLIMFFIVGRLKKEHLKNNNIIMIIVTIFLLLNLFASAVICVEFDPNNYPATHILSTAMLQVFYVASPVYCVVINVTHLIFFCILEMLYQPTDIMLNQLSDEFSPVVAGE